MRILFVLGVVGSGALVASSIRAQGTEPVPPAQPSDVAPVQPAPPPALPPPAPPLPPAGPVPPPLVVVVEPPPDVPAPPLPDPHARRGFAFAVRTGIAAPLGNALVATTQMGGTGGPVSQASTSALLLPLWIDAAYRITPRWHAGLYFQIADALSGTACGGGCGGYDVRFGAAGEHHFGPARTADGWLGLGAGYEILHTSTPSLTTAYRGFEFGMAQAGVDIRSGRGAFRWGPFAALTLAQYDHVRQISPVSDISITPNEAMHFWFFIGLRGTYDL